MFSKKPWYETGNRFGQINCCGGFVVTSKFAVIFFVLAACSAGCSDTKSLPPAIVVNSSSAASPVSDKDSITAAIEKHLRSNSGINMSVMNMTVTDVSVTGDQAQANTEFHLKQGGTSMLITYSLERHAGDWIVLSNHPSGGQFAHPPMDKTHSGAAASSSTQALPDVSEYLKSLPSAGKNSAR